MTIQPKKTNQATATQSPKKEFIVLVPAAHHIEPACEVCLQALEKQQIQVFRSFGQSDISTARSFLASNALKEGYGAVMWIDSDIVFNPDDVLKLWKHNLPIVGGIYAKKVIPAVFAMMPLPNDGHFVFGKDGGLKEVQRLGTGFLMIRRQVFERVAQHYRMPMCGGKKDKHFLPYFDHLVMPDANGELNHLSEDYSFCERARAAGFKIMADTTIRLGHLGIYPYSFEDGIRSQERYANYLFNLKAAPAAAGAFVESGSPSDKIPEPVPTPVK